MITSTWHNTILHKVSTPFYKGVVKVNIASLQLQHKHKHNHRQERDVSQVGGAGAGSKGKGADTDTDTDAVEAAKKVYAAAVRAAQSVVGSKYASEFEPPSSGEFYCSSLVEWAFARALGGHDQPSNSSSMNALFTHNITFKMLFVPLSFWTEYVNRKYTLPTENLL